MNSNSYLFYITVILSTSIFAFLAQKCKERSFKYINRIFYLISFLIAWSVSAIRLGIGTDYMLYQNMYYELTSNTNIFTTIRTYSYIEPGWIILNFIVKYVFNDVKYVFILSSFITLICVFKAIYEHSNKIDIGLSVFIFMCIIYNPSFNLVRQFMAIGIIMNSLKYLEQRNFKKFFYTIILASCFHYTAIIFLPIYILTNKKSNDLVLKFIFFITLLGLLVNYDNILSLIISLSPAFEKYSIYYASFFKISKIDLIYKILMIGLILLYRKYLMQGDIVIGKFTDIYFIGVSLSILAFFAPFVGRITYYFDITQIIFIPFITKMTKRKLDKFIISLIIVIYFLLYWFYYYMYLNYHETATYITFWLWTP